MGYHDLSAFGGKRVSTQDRAIRGGESDHDIAEHEGPGAAGAASGGLERRACARCSGAGSSARPRAAAAARRRIPAGAGAALGGGVQMRMERTIGADLSGVRVHTGGDSAEAADSLGARAFTVGSDVHFGRGEFAPGSKEGDRLLAHELTHVVQGQKSGIQRKPGGGAAAARRTAKNTARPAAAASTARRTATTKPAATKSASPATPPKKKPTRWATTPPTSSTAASDGAPAASTAARRRARRGGRRSAARRKRAAPSAGQEISRKPEINAAAPDHRPQNLSRGQSTGAAASGERTGRRRKGGPAPAAPAGLPPADASKIEHNQSQPLDGRAGAAHPLDASRRLSPR